MPSSGDISPSHFIADILLSDHKTAVEAISCRVFGWVWESMDTGHINFCNLCTAEILLRIEPINRHDSKWHFSLVHHISHTVAITNSGHNGENPHAVKSVAGRASARQTAMSAFV